MNDVFTLVMAASMLIVASAANEQATVTIALGRTASGPFPHLWENCVGSGHATLTSRADWRAQVSKARQDIGFRKVRFHGIFDDDFGAGGTSIDPAPSYVNVDSLADFLVSEGMSAVVELGFMPSWLASSNRTKMNYRANVSPPTNYSAWGLTVRQLAEHLVQRFGVDEIATNWPFEVWNEPNAPFWTGSQDDYFHLYAEAAHAIKSVSPRLRVGGPVTCANAAWITDLRGFCELHHVPLDFISTHTYTGDWQGVNDVSKVLSVWEEARAAAGHLPVLITEFGSTYKSGRVNQSLGTCHDNFEASSFLARAYLAAIDSPTANLELLSYWAVSDVFEEGGFPANNASFSGDFGLVNIYGIPKPGYRMLQLMHSMGTSRLPTRHHSAGAGPCKTTVGSFAAVDNSTGENTIVVFNQAARGLPIEACQVTLTGQNVDGLAATVFRIDANHSNPMEKWIDLGMPQWPTAAQNALIMKASELQSENGTFPLLLEIPPQGVAFVRWPAGPS